MKRLTIAGIIFSLSLLLSGCFAIEKYYQWKYAREKKEIIKIVESEEADLLIKDFLKNFDENAFTPNGKIQSYTIDYDSLSYIQTGSMSVVFYVNGDPTLNVECLLKMDPQGKLVRRSATYSIKLEDFNNE